MSKLKEKTTWMGILSAAYVILGDPQALVAAPLKESLPKVGFALCLALMGWFAQEAKKESAPCPDSKPPQNGSP